MTDTSTLRERIAIAISGAPFPSKQSLAKADRVLAIIDAQTEQPDLQLSAPKVGSAPQDQTEVSPAPDAVAEADDALLSDAYIAMRDAMGVIDADEGPGMKHSRILNALADARVRIERRTAAKGSRP